MIAYRLQEYSEVRPMTTCFPLRSINWRETEDRRQQALNIMWKGRGRNHSEKDLSRLEEKGNAACITGVLWVTSVRTDGPLFQ